jgi:hypothetical protein
VVSGGGAFDHVVVVAMENHSYDSVLGGGTDSVTPYLHELASECGSAQGFVDSSQPSLPNYVDLLAGQHPDYMDNVSVGRMPGKADCGPVLPVAGAVASPCYSADDNLFNQLAGDFTAYGESAPAADCRKGDATTGWLPRHVPSLYFSDLATSQADCSMVQPLPADFSSIDLSRRFTFITPNGCHDMHSVSAAVDLPGGCDAPVPATYNGRSYGSAFANGCWDGSSNDTCTRERGDQFLSDLIPALTSSATYEAGRTAIVVWWDEDGVAGVGAAHIPLIVISPYTQPGDGILPTQMTHQDLLLTFEDLLGVPPLGDLSTTPYGWVTGPTEVADPGPGSTGRTDLRPFFHLN